MEEVRGYQSDGWLQGKIRELRQKIFRLQMNIFSSKETIKNATNIFQALVIGGYFLAGIFQEGLISPGKLVLYYIYIYISMSVTALLSILDSLVEQNKNLTNAEKPYRFYIRKQLLRSDPIP